MPGVYSHIQCFGNRRNTGRSYFLLSIKMLSVSCPWSLSTDHAQLKGVPTLPALYASTMLWIVVVVPPTVMNNPMATVNMCR
jgi:hypothetical protein